MLAAQMRHTCFRPTYRCSALCFYRLAVPMTAVHDRCCFGPPIFCERNNSGMQGEFLDISPQKSHPLWPD